MKMGWTRRASCLSVRGHGALHLFRSSALQCFYVALLQCNAVSWQEEGEKAKKKEPLPRLCHSDRDEDDANYDLG